MKKIFILMALFLLPAPAHAAQSGDRYEGWIIRCDDSAPAYEAQTSRCEAFQRLVAAENGARMAEFAIGFNQPADSIAPRSVAATVAARDTARGVIALPLGISLSDGVHLHLDHTAFTFEVRYCLEDGCYAYLPLPPATLDKFRRSLSAKITYRLLDDTVIELPLALSGFTAAMQAIR